jgi:hypothetical protein
MKERSVKLGPRRARGLGGHLDGNRLPSRWVAAAVDAGSPASASHASVAAYSATFPQCRHSSPDLRKSSRNASCPVRALMHRIPNTVARRQWVTFLKEPSRVFFSLMDAKPASNCRCTGEAAFRNRSSSSLAPSVLQPNHVKLRKTPCLQSRSPVRCQSRSRRCPS